MEGDSPGLGRGQRSVVEINPRLLGCGQKHEQVDDAVLQGVEVLRERKDRVAQPGYSPPGLTSPPSSL